MSRARRTRGSGERTVVSCPLTVVTKVLVPIVETRPVAEEDEVGGGVVEEDG